jgi:hypothetical protein
VVYEPMDRCRITYFIQRVVEGRYPNMDWVVKMLLAHTPATPCPRILILCQDFGAVKELYSLIFDGLYGRGGWQIPTLSKVGRYDGDTDPELVAHYMLQWARPDSELLALLRVLVATGVVGRGVDLSGIRIVCQFQPGPTAAGAVQGANRTGRLGQDFQSLNLVTYNGNGIEVDRCELANRKHMLALESNCVRRYFLEFAHENNYPSLMNRVRVQIRSRALRIFDQAPLRVRPDWWLPHHCCGFCRKRCKCARCPPLPWMDPLGYMMFLGDPAAFFRARGHTCTHTRTHTRTQRNTHAHMHTWCVAC